MIKHVLVHSRQDCVVLHLLLCLFRRCRIKVLILLLLCRNKDAIPLRDSQVDLRSDLRLGVDAIDLDDSEVVALYAEVLADKGADVDDAQEVGLARVDGEFGAVLKVGDEGAVGDGFAAAGVFVIFRGEEVD